MRVINDRFTSSHRWTHRLDEPPCEDLPRGDGTVPLGYHRDLGRVRRYLLGRTRLSARHVPR